MNSYGTIFKVTLYGESHQDAIGVIIDGVVPGTLINEKTIKEDLGERRPGLVGTTKRKELDEFIITSGVFNGYATGTPIHVTIQNSDFREKDYVNLINHPRPSHADFVAHAKYKGFNDYRGGGMFSGRLTAPLVIAGAVAKMMVPFEFEHKLRKVGALKDIEKIDDYLKEIEQEGNSVGGVIELRVSKMDIGLGEPFFNKIDSEIAKMMFSIPGVKGVEIGTGFKGVEMLGSEFNDVIIDEKGTTKTNHSGGTSGGISNGNDLLIKVFIKPTPSIKIKQNTFNFKENKMKELTIKGRHDVCFARRTGIVLQNALAIVLADLYLLKWV